MIEKLYPIKGYEGLYSITKSGKVWSFYKKRFLKSNLGNNGYYRVCLLKNGIIKFKNIHRLLAINFIDNPNNKPFINHINGIRSDNRIENLEWCTQKENCIHAYKTGLNSYGMRFLTMDDAKYIRKNYIPRKNSNELANMFGVSVEIIYKIIQYKTYTKHGAT